MGIQVEFNPDLALRKSETPNREKAECLPQKLEEGKKYSFLKKGQRNFWLQGDIPLRKTDGNQNLSRPLASIRVIQAFHFMKADEVYTRGIYRINEVYDPHDKTIHFEGFEKRVI